MHEKPWLGPGRNGADGHGGPGSSTGDVPGTTDQADIEVTVTEKATGSLQAGLGYSSTDGLVLSASIAQQ